MQIRHSLRFLCAGGVLAAVALVPVVSQAAAARAQGGSGYSGTLSSNLVTRQQQLICDPDEPIRGATSTSYDPFLVRLVNLQAGPGYIVGGAVELVRFDPETQSFSAPFFQNLFGAGGYFAQDFDPNLLETGLLRVIYEKFGDAGQIEPVGELLDEDKGVTQPGSIDTHAMIFQPTGFASPDETLLAQYTIFAGPNDYMEGLDDNGELFRLGPDQLVGVTVGLPEPAGAALLLAGLIAVGGRGRRRTPAA